MNKTHQQFTPSYSHRTNAKDAKKNGLYAQTLSSYDEDRVV